MGVYSNPPPKGSPPEPTPSPWLITQAKTTTRRKLPELGEDPVPAPEVTMPPCGHTAVLNGSGGRLPEATREDAASALRRAGQEFVTELAALAQRSATAAHAQNLDGRELEEVRALIEEVQQDVSRTREAVDEVERALARHRASSVDHPDRHHSALDRPVSRGALVTAAALLFGASLLLWVAAARDTLRMRAELERTSQEVEALRESVPE